MTVTHGGEQLLLLRRYLRGRGGSGSGGSSKQQDIWRQRQHKQQEAVSLEAAALVLPS